MGKTQTLKSVQKEQRVPTIIQAHSFVCHCFGIGEKELSKNLERIRTNRAKSLRQERARKKIKKPEKSLPRKWWRNTPERAEAKNALWSDAVLTIQRETLSDHICRQEGKPLFSFTGKVTEEIAFSLLKIYEGLLPKLDIEGVSPEKLLWMLLENVFMPMVFIKLGQSWQRGLGTEFQGDLCWYLPIIEDGKKLKPIPRILDYWLRTAGFRTAYGVSQDMGTSPLRRKVDRWRTGKIVPSLADLQQLVHKFAAKTSWLEDDSVVWKTRFTLACAMQRVCDAMDDYFKELCEDSSLKLTKLIKQITGERIVCDDEKILADPHRFFAARLWQLKLKLDGNWEKLVTLEPKPGGFPAFISTEEDDRYRKELFRQMDPANRFLQFIEKTAVSDGVSSRNCFALDDYLFDLGVSELNRILDSKRKEAGKR
jgi:hypothetical protein